MATRQQYIQMVQVERDNDQESIEIYRHGIYDAKMELRNTFNRWLENVSYISITLASALIAIGVSFSTTNKKLQHEGLFWAGIIVLFINGFQVIFGAKILAEADSVGVAKLGLEEQYLLAKKKQIANDIIDETIDGPEAYKKLHLARIKYIEKVKEVYVASYKKEKLEIRTDIAAYLLFLGLSLISFSAFNKLRTLVAIFIFITFIFILYFIYSVYIYNKTQKEKAKWDAKMRKIAIDGLDKELNKSRLIVSRL